MSNKCSGAEYRKQEKEDEENSMEHPKINMLLNRLLKVL